MTHRTTVVSLRHPKLSRCHCDAVSIRNVLTSVSYSKRWWGTILPADGKAGLRMTRSSSSHEKPTHNPNRTADNHHPTSASSSNMFAQCLYPQIGLGIRRQTVVIDASNDRRFSASSQTLAVPLRCSFDPECFDFRFLCLALERFDSACGWQSRTADDTIRECAQKADESSEPHRRQSSSD